MDETPTAARNNVQTRPHADITFDRLIVRGCRIRPESVAAKHGQAQISFRALDRQSDQIAHWLHSYGIRTEMRVIDRKSVV